MSSEALLAECERGGRALRIYVDESRGNQWVVIELRAGGRVFWIQARRDELETLATGLQRGREFFASKEAA